MSNGIVSKSSLKNQANLRQTRSAASGTITLYVQGSLLGFVSTKLRAHSEASLDAIYRVVETSALGTLSRKHFFFVLEDQGVMKGVCAAYLTHYKDPSDALSKPFGKPKLLKRRSYKRLVESVSAGDAQGRVEALLWDTQFCEKVTQAVHKTFEELSRKKSGGNPAGTHLLGA